MHQRVDQLYQAEIEASMQPVRSLSDRLSSMAEEDGLARVMATALHNLHAIHLLECNDHEATRAFDRLMAFEESASVRIRELICNAWRNRAADLIEHNDYAGAVAACEHMSQMFRSDAGADVRQHCARELFNLSNQLVSREHDRRDEAVEVLSVLVECFKEDDRISVRIQVAESLVNMIYLLASLNRYGEAIRCGDETVALFGTATDPSIVEQVRRAKVNQANARYLAGAQSTGKE